MTHGLSKTFTFVIYFILLWPKWIKYTRQARWIHQDYECKEEDEHNQTNPIGPWGVRKGWTLGGKNTRKGQRSWRQRDDELRFWGCANTQGDEFLTNNP
jgi:hypothetical protein